MVVNVSLESSRCKPSGIKLKVFHTFKKISIFVRWTHMCLTLKETLGLLNDNQIIENESP
jgi:hypothetical protein